MENQAPSPLNNVITIDDDRIKNHLDRIVRGRRGGHDERIVRHGGSVLRCPGCVLATCSSAHFGAASPTQICERFRTSTPVLISEIRSGFTSNELTLREEQGRGSTMVFANSPEKAPQAFVKAVPRSKGGRPCGCPSEETRLLIEIVQITRLQAWGKVSHLPPRDRLFGASDPFPNLWRFIGSHCALGNAIGCQA
jgi:hypothetical protein